MGETGERVWTTTIQVCGGWYAAYCISSKNSAPLIIQFPLPNVMVSNIRQRSSHVYAIELHAAGMFNIKFCL